MTENTVPTPNSAPTKNNSSKGILIIVAIVLLLVIAPILAFRSGIVRTPAWLLKTMPSAILSPGLNNDEAMLATMLENNQSGVCTFSNMNDNSQVKYFIKDQKIRIEVTTTLDEETVHNYTLNDGEYLYTWTDQTNQGTKMKIPTQAETDDLTARLDEITGDLQTPSALSNDRENAVDEQQEQVTINCEYQALADDLFTIPANIKFLEFGEMLDSARMIESTEDVDNTPEATTNADAQMPSAEELEQMEAWATEMKEQYGE